VMNHRYLLAARVPGVLLTQNTTSLAAASAVLLHKYAPVPEIDNSSALSADPTCANLMRTVVLADGVECGVEVVG
jgi:hypothetical protein